MLVALALMARISWLFKISPEMFKARSGSSGLDMILYESTSH